jgi:transposase
VAGATACCCHQALYTQPDFANVESLLEAHCQIQGFKVLFLLKFHCELNFIEQCWGYAKRKYREFPASTAEADLEKNLLASLEMVPLDSMRR